MSPRFLLRILGLCNVVAGALLVFAPALVGPVAGVDSPAATLARRSAAALLIAVAVGAWSMPAGAATRYLWIFGVGVKLAAAVIWATAAVASGPQVWMSAGVDLALAVLIASGLIVRSGAAPESSASN